MILILFIYPIISEKGSESVKKGSVKIKDENRIFFIENEESSISRKD